MYLTDYREQSLKEVITQLEPGLFKKVTGLSVKDFELLVSLGVFRDSVMNDAVYKFRRYEDASLSYTGIEKHSYDARVGLFDTSLTKEDFAEMARQDTLLDETGRLVRAGTTEPSASTDVRAESNRIRPHAQNRTGEAKRRPETAPQPPSEQTASVTPSDKSPSDATPTAKRDWVVDALEEKEIAYVDLRADGDQGLWAIGGGELDGIMENLAKRGARFEFTFRGNTATRGRAGWLLAGYPDERTPDGHTSTAATDAKLDVLAPGDTVFHKAFGYGEVIDIDREGGSIVVALGVDKRGKPKHRKFLFPNSFEQGLLSI